MATNLDLAIKEFDPTKKEVWEGNVLKEDAFKQLYIEKLYGDQLHYVKFTEITVFFTKEFGDYSFIDGPVLWNKNKGTMFDLQNVPEECLTEYRKTSKRFTMYPVALIQESFDGVGHVLYILYDKKLNQIEFFDSTAHINLLLDKKYDVFANFFIKIYSRTVKFDYNHYLYYLAEYELKYCKSEQYLKSAGYCSIWFLWFLEIKLKNRNLSSKEIIDKIIIVLNKNPTKICEILAGYAQFVDKLTNDYKYVVIDNRIDRIDLKSSVKLAKRKKRIGGLVAGLIVLLSSSFVFRKSLKSVFRKNLVKK